MSVQTVSKSGLVVIVVTIVGCIAYFYKENYARDLRPMESTKKTRVNIAKTREEQKRENQALAAINPLLAAQPTLDVKAQQMLLSQQLEDKLRRTTAQSNPFPLDNNITLKKQSLDVPMPNMITYPPTYPPTQAPTYPPTEAPTQVPTYLLTQAPTYPPTQAPTYVFTEPTMTPTQSPVEVLEDILKMTPTPTPMIDVSSLMVAPVYEEDGNMWVGQSYEEKFMYVK